tara:strand:- start:2285 stop:2869 length:585 start_codon:yes stop_codon:yes gene_type:complete
MAYGDIICLTPDSAPIDHYPLNASEAFDIGEFVTLNTDGEVAVMADEATPDGVIGIAATGGDTTATASSATGVGIFRYTTLGDFVPGDNAAQTGDMVAVRLFVPQTKYASRNFATDGAGTDVTPTTALAGGQEAEYFVVGGVHGLDVGGAGAANTGLITDVLDTNMTPIELSQGTGVWVVFRPVHHQLNKLDPA